MSTLIIPLFFRISKTFLNYPHISPDLALCLTISSSNYSCLEQISMVQKMFELLKFDYVMNLFSFFLSFCCCCYTHVASIYINYIYKLASHCHGKCMLAHFP